MGNVVNLRERLKQKSLHESIFPFIENINGTYHLIEEEDELVVVIRSLSIVFVFMSFSDLGTLTSKSPITKCLEKNSSFPRYSKGEWVVDTLFQLEERFADYLLEQAENERNKIPFLIQEISKQK
ncbi:hypothetical protein IMZ31_21290 (plasmid) [Pontibacillus sp. ALD_SL1]|uniref:hypothetical protein n=1 Tax=Pontibacillus sp. ALD_SL1 TaxID=2777185 RepID=UPI001A96EDFE|nr:hypothetical protein [Pontibacillus sp. ALD_SL1]QST03086.1 hypothetical protein IMZ31_21290 [Pontibacillus sp. ALD_SL1]